MSIIQQPVDNWITGSDPIQTTEGVIASGQNIAARTPLGQVTATGKLVAWNPAAEDGSQVAVYIASYAINATGADTKAQVIKVGTFNPEEVAWPEGVTNAQKLTAFVGTPISLQLPY